MLIFKQKVLYSSSASYIREKYILIIKFLRYSYYDYTPDVNVLLCNVR